MASAHVEDIHAQHVLRFRHYVIRYTKQTRPFLPMQRVGSARLILIVVAILRVTDLSYIISAILLLIINDMRVILKIIV